MSSLLRVRVCAYAARSVSGFTDGIFFACYFILLHQGLENFQINGVVDAFGLSLKPMQWLGAIIATFHIFTLILEIPTGVFADSLGRKFAVVICRFWRVLFLLSLLVLAYISDRGILGPAVFIAVGFFREFCHATANAFRSGSFVAWLVDSLEAEGEGAQRNVILTTANNFVRFFFVVGSVLGIYAVLEGWVHKVLGLAILAEVVVALLLFVWMQENRQYSFLRVRDFFSRRFLEPIRKSHAVWRDGWKAFSVSPVLWIIFATTATFFALSDVIAYGWPLFVKSHFPHNLERFSAEWVGLFISFNLAAFIGGYFLVKWLKYIDKRGGSTRGGTIVWMALFANTLVALPIILFGWLTMMKSEYGSSLSMFVLCLVVFHLCKGSLFSLADCIRNEFVSPDTQERSTILSIGSMLESLLGAFLYFFGVGKVAGSMVWWMLPAAILVFLSILQTPIALRKLRTR